MTELWYYSFSNIFDTIIPQIILLTINVEHFVLMKGMFST